MAEEMRRELPDMLGENKDKNRADNKKAEEMAAANGTYVGDELAKIYTPRSHESWIENKKDELRAKHPDMTPEEIQTKAEAEFEEHRTAQNPKEVFGSLA